MLQGAPTAAAAVVAEEAAAAQEPAAGGDAGGTLFAGLDTSPAQPPSKSQTASGADKPAGMARGRQQVGLRDTSEEPMA